MHRLSYNVEALFRSRKKSGSRTAKSNPIVCSARCAARSVSRFSALNCRIRFHISTMNSEQAVLHQLPEEFQKILTKQPRLDVEFAQQLRISIFDALSRRDHLLHARASLIQAPIAFRFQIEEHGLLFDNAH